MVQGRPQLLEVRASLASKTKHQKFHEVSRTHPIDLIHDSPPVLLGMTFMEYLDDVVHIDLICICRWA